MTAWRPDAFCDGHTAESRAQWLVSNRGLSYSAARDQVLREFPFVFASEATIAWRPEAMCAGSTAESRAQWLMDNRGLSFEDAKAVVMSEFVEVFAATSLEHCWSVATVEQRCHLRDAGYLVMHGCVPEAMVRAARECASVQAALGRAKADQWSEGGGSEPALLALALPAWPTARRPVKTWADVRRRPVRGDARGPPQPPARPACWHEVGTR